MKKKVAVLGSTGSIGTQTLKVCKRAGYEVTALAANRSADILEQQAREFTPRRVAIFDENAYKDLKVRLADMDIDILTGMDGLCELTVLDETEIVCNAVIGMIGLRPTLAAIAAKKTLALSNKETLVAGGICGGQWSEDSPGGQRTQRNFSVFTGKFTKPAPENSAHGFRRPVPRIFQSRVGTCYIGRCVKASKLVYGSKDYD